MRYEDWADAMAPHEAEYGWDAHEVTTSDGYILTVFKIFKRATQHNYTGSMAY